MTSPHGERDRFLPPADMPRRIMCSCGRNIEADEVSICQRCDKVMCSDCSAEFETETCCCAACIAGHCDALVRERHLARLESQISASWERTWERRYRSMLRFASTLMFVTAALGIFIFCTWRW